MRNALREKYACGAISPAKVINTVENRKAVSPAITEFDSSVSNTLIPTLPQSTVVKRKFTSLRRDKTFMASGLPSCASTSRRRRLIPSQPQTVAFAMGAVAGYHAAMTMPSPSEVKKAANKILDSGKAIAKAQGQTITQTYIGQGDPAEEIVDCAEKCAADLIVTGRRGLGSLGALVQGSTSQKINHLAKCACLSVT